MKKTLISILATTILSLSLFVVYTFALTATDTTVDTEINLPVDIDLQSLVDELAATYSITGASPTLGTVLLPASSTVATYTPNLDAVGVDTFQYTATGVSGTATGTVTVNIHAVNQPPVCDEATASESMIWPPNHKMTGVDVEGVTDPDSTIITIKIDSIESSEPDNDTGDGNTTDDTGVETSDVDEENTTDSATVRAERKGNGDGRVYTINFTADDVDFTGDDGGLEVIDGGDCSGSISATVPHDASEFVVPPGNAYGLYKEKNEHAVAGAANSDNANANSNNASSNSSNSNNANSSNDKGKKNDDKSNKSDNKSNKSDNKSDKGKSKGKGKGK